jgi:two-component system sensor histidine kinase/response regulator
MAEVKQGRVLVVEDNEVNQVLAVAILAKLGHRADVAGDGRQGVELVLHRAYEAVLMDCQLPVLDGYQATAEIRRREGTARRTPIIAMTAAVLQDGQTCLAAGMDDHIAKPVLLAEVQAVLAPLAPGRRAPSGWRMDGPAGGVDRRGPRPAPAGRAGRARS